MEGAIRRGLEAIAWIVDERGLGGGRELDGLAWQLPLDQLWETYVEAFTRREVAMTGGEVKVGRLGQTLFPFTGQTRVIERLDIWCLISSFDVAGTSM